MTREDGNDQPKKTPATIWSGHYRKWSDAVAAADEINAASTDPAAFDSHQWIERQRGMLDDARNSHAPRHSSLPLLAAGIGARSIVDFGGGSGWAYELLAPFTRDSLSRYTVIEQEVTTKIFSEEFEQNNNVEFVSSASFSEVVPREATDLLYSNSTLQYLPDNEAYLGLIETYQPRMILIDDFQTSSGAEFFSLQHYYGVEIPCRFSSVSDLEGACLRSGYNLLGAWSYPKTYGGVLEPRVSETTGGGEISNWSPTDAAVCEMNDFQFRGERLVNE
jgi:putative methyltransferase (TIGR04325 family)